MCDDALGFSVSKLIVVANLYLHFRKYDPEHTGKVSAHDVPHILQKVFGSNAHRAEWAAHGNEQDLRVSFDDLIHSPLAVLIHNELWACRREDEYNRAMKFLKTIEVRDDVIDLYDLGQLIAKTWPSEDDTSRRNLFQLLTRMGANPLTSSNSGTTTFSSILNVNDSVSYDRGSRSQRPASALVGRTSQASVSTRHVARCLNATPNLLSSTACYYDSTILEDSEGTRLFAEAEALLLRSQTLGCVWNEASDQFRTAAKLLQREDRLPDAANAWVRASDCFRALNATTEEASCLVEAAMSLRSCGMFEEAVHCFSDVVELYSAQGLKGKVARYTRMLAETNAEAGDPVHAAVSYQLAADQFQELGMNSDCRSSLMYAAVILVENGFASEAIEIFERLANMEVDKTYWYFRAMLCYVGTINAEDGVRHLDGLERARNAMGMYTDVCVSFQSGTEHDTIRDLIRFTQESDRESTRRTAERYITRRTLEPWVEAMLLRIVENVHKKHKVIESMMLYPSN